MRGNAIVRKVALCLLAVRETTIGYSFSWYHRRFRSSSSVWSMAQSTTDASSATTNHRRPKHVCIVGGGIMGTCTVYYLATRYQIPCTIIDRTGTIAPAASGKAGGFLAYDWNDGTPTEELTHRSFRLHQELAELWGPESIQYRALTCVSVNLLEGQKRPSDTNPLEWVHPKSASVQRVQNMGTESTIAQVHPKLFCERAWQEAVAAVPACKLLHGKVMETLYSTTSKTGTDDNALSVIGVKLEDGTVVETDAVLYACGPWNPPGQRALMQGIKYHSLIVPTRQLYQQCVFFSGNSRVVGDLEVYVRPNRTAYCTGYPDAPCHVTDAPGQETVHTDKIATIRRAVEEVARTTVDDEGGFVLDSDQVVPQACYLPSTTDGRPMIGPWPGPARGAYVATGHTCWGILLGPATGECMASLMATGTSPVPLQAFRPSRLISS